SMFDPIFHAADENRARLQAECFAVGLDFIYPMWNAENQNRLAMAIVLEIIDRYGEDHRTGIAASQVGMAIDDPEAIGEIARAAFKRVYGAIHGRTNQ
ncbi:MAG: hypothetical protein ACREA9_29045, partial [Pyrinomonadaceae bacterium]